MRRNLKIVSFHESHAPFLRYSVFYISNHLINFETWDAMMSINTVDTVLFWIHPLNSVSFGNETWQLANVVMSNFLSQNTAWFGELCLKSWPLLIYQPTKFIKNVHDKLLFFTLSKICTETIKNHLLKLNKSQNIIILSKL